MTRTSNVQKHILPGPKLVNRPLATGLYDRKNNTTWSRKNNFWRLTQLSWLLNVQTRLRVQKKFSTRYTTYNLLKQYKRLLLSLGKDCREECCGKRRRQSKMNKWYWTFCKSTVSAVKELNKRNKGLPIVNKQARKKRATARVGGQMYSAQFSAVAIDRQRTMQMDIFKAELPVLNQKKHTRVSSKMRPPRSLIEA